MLFLCFFNLVPPPLQPRSSSLQLNHTGSLQAIDFSTSYAAPSNSTGNAMIKKNRAQSLTVKGPVPPTPENPYSFAGQDATYGQHKSGIPLTNYFEQSGIGQARKPEGDARSSLTSNDPPSGIPLNEALSMKGYGTLAQCTVGPAVPPRTPLSEALQIKGFSQMPVSEGDSACSTTSIAKEAEMEVKRLLKQQSFSDVQVKPGTPLNEALAQKGIVNTPMGYGSSRSSVSSRSGSVPDDDPEDHYNVPRNNQPALFPDNDHYQSPPSRIPEGHYQSPRSLMDDPPDQVYNVPPPPRPAPMPPRSPNRRKRSTLLSQSATNEDGMDKVNGTTNAPPVISRSNKPRPPPVNRDVKPGRSESFKNDIPQMTKDSVHYVSLCKLRVNDGGKPVPRPRSNIKKSEYSEVDLDGTLAMERKFTINEIPQVPERTRSRDSFEEVYSSDNSTSSEVSYTKMRVSNHYSFLSSTV